MAAGINGDPRFGSQHGRSLIESAVRHDRAVLLIVLVTIPLAAWVWIVVMARDMYGTMRGASAWMMTSTWDTPHVLLLWAMWAVMMTAMMVPTAAPLILLYAATARSQAETGNPTWRIYSLAAGYVIAWSLFSAVATAAQRLLATAEVITPMMEAASTRAAGGILAIAGLYQLTPWKHACLRSCRPPLGFMVQRSHRGASGAFRLGIEHGGHCLGCCWALMLILFAGGVMNLWVIVTLTLWVMVEKIAPFGERTPIVTGIVLLMAAAWMIAR